MLGLVHLVSGDYADLDMFRRLADAVAAQAGPEAFAVHYLAGRRRCSARSPTASRRQAWRRARTGGREAVRPRPGVGLRPRRPARRHYPEDRVFRVDHFLGKEPVEDLLVLRFANTLIEPLWNRQWIDHFEITMAEDFDVADRGSFYDAVGTVRDVVQNHLLQVLTYLLMDPPLTTGADDQRDAKYRLLRTVRTVDPAEVVRGRYDGYDTPGVAPESTTETYVALTLHVDDWRWAGCPCTSARARPCRSRSLTSSQCCGRSPGRCSPAGRARCRSTRSACGCSRMPVSPSRFW